MNLHSPGPTAIIPGTAYRLTTRDIVSVLFYTKRVFLLTFLAVVLSTLAIVVLAPRIYKTSVDLVLEPPHAKPLLVESEPERFSLVSPVDTKDVNTVIFLVKSPEVLKQVVIRSGLAAATDQEGIRKEIKDLEGHLETEPMTDSKIVRVTMSGNDPQRVAAQLNHLVDVYLEYQTRLEQEPGRVAFFETESDRFRDRYEELSRITQARMSELGIADPAVQKANALALIRDLEVRKNGLHVDLLALMAKRNSLNQAVQHLEAEGQLTGIPKDVLFEYPALVEMEKSLAQLIINVRVARNDYQPSSKPVRDAENQYANMRRQIREYLKRIIADLKTQEENLGRAIADLEAEIARANKMAVTIAGNGLEVDRLMVELGLAKDQYILYSKKTDETRIRSSKEMTQFVNVRVANRAEVPTSPYFPNPRVMLPLSVVIGLLLAVLASSISYFVGQTIRSPLDVRTRTPVALLGCMNAIPARTT